MKTIITFAVILGILSGGIYYYVQQKNDVNNAVEQQDVHVLTYNIPVKHPSWSDKLVPISSEPGRVKREAGNDYATILELTPDLITVSWDRWGIETFKKGADGTYTLSND